MFLLCDKKTVYNLTATGQILMQFYTRNVSYLVLLLMPFLHLSVIVSCGIKSGGMPVCALNGQTV